MDELTFIDKVRKIIRMRHDDIVSAMDIFPTIAGLAGAKMPADRKIDGIDISPVLQGEKMECLGERELLYYHATSLQAIRIGNMKLHLPRKQSQIHFMGRRNVGRGTIDSLDVPMLFNLEDRGIEKKDIADQYPYVVNRLLNRVDEHRKELGDWDVIGYDEHPLNVSKDIIIKRPVRRK